MTTIGSTNPYYASIYSVLRKNSGDQTASGGGDYSEPRQSRSGNSAANMSGSDTVFGAKLASALWSIDSQSGLDSSQSGASTWLGSQPDTNFEQEFLGMSGKTFAERIRDQYLKDHKLTENDLKAMSPADRQAVEADIRKSILEAMGVNGRQQDAAMAMGAGGQAGAPSGVKTDAQSGTDGGNGSAAGRTSAILL